MTPDQTGAVLAGFAWAFVQALGLPEDRARATLERLTAILDDQAASVGPDDATLQPIADCHRATAQVLIEMGA